MVKLKPAIWVIIILVILIIAGTSVIVYVCSNKPSSETFGNNTSLKVFRTSPSLTFLKREDIPRKDFMNLTYEETVKQLKELTFVENAQKGEVLNVVDGNLLSMPTYFNAHDKWPGCLPPPAFQGNCGSCWAFAVTTCLSSRFYIETCGNTGCYNFPQFNRESFNRTVEEINERYKFRRVSLIKIGKILDKNNNRQVTREEWLSTVKEFHHQALYEPENKFFALQALMFILNFHSLGSIPFSKRHPNTIKIMERANKVFDWGSKLSGKNTIDIDTYTKRVQNQPIPLSAEKMILCCIPNCFVSKRYFKEKTQCQGESLVDAWRNIRDLGTISSLCSGYSLDNWYRGRNFRTCGELLGPEFSYCSGYLPEDTDIKVLNPILEKSNKTGISPFALAPRNMVLPWQELQYFVFKAKNAYEVKDDVLTIQREIIKRGPVSSGFHVYPDFENVFGARGLGGQMFKEGESRILGGERDNLIYMHMPKKGEKKPRVGHAVVIVGWGSYKDIPYWICLNSWGLEWGTSGFTPYQNRTGLPYSMEGGGYFWFVRGINNCGIEENVVAGQPNLLNLSYPGTKQKFGWGLPYPEENTVKYIDPIDPEKLDQRQVGFVFNPYVEGGGQFVRDVTEHEKNAPVQRWALDSMEPPSPYIFFWPEERPLYIVGKILTKLEKSYKETKVHVSEETYKNLERIHKTSDHTFLVINEEHIQLDRLCPDDNVHVFIFRAISGTLLEAHPVGSEILVFPYHELNGKDLDFLPKYPAEERSINFYENKLNPLPLTWET